FIAVTATQSELMAVAQNDYIFAVEGRAEFFNPLYVHNGGAMDSEKSFRIESGFETAHRLSEQMRLIADVQMHIIIGCVYPIDLFYFQEKYPPRRFDHEAIQMLSLLLHVFQKSLKSLVE